MITQRIGQIAKIHSIFLSLIATIALASNSPSNTQQIDNFLSHVKAELAAKGYRVELNTGNFGPLITERSCMNPLAIKLTTEPLQQQRNTVELRCESNEPWRLYLNVEIHLYDQVVAAARNIPRNTRITPADLMTQEHIINKSHYTSYREIDAIVGMVAKQTLREGAIVQPRQLSAPELVKRGDRVVIVADNGRVAIKMNGVALEDGRKGEQISIKNLSSSRIVKGYVSEMGVVNVVL